MTAAASRPYRVVLVDDERLARAGLRVMLAEYPQLSVIGEARDGDEAVRTIRQLEPDIVFVDIRMPGPDGFEVLRAVSGFNRKPAFIFVTAYATRAVDAYDADAVDYLLKPFNATRLARAVYRAMRYLRGIRETSARPTNRRLLVNTPQETVFLDLDEVAIVEVERNYLAVRTVGSSRYFVRQTLSDFATNLPREFVRVSRSAIVNLTRVRAVRRVAGGRFAFEFPDGAIVTSSRRYQRQLRSAIRPR